ncbi:hypothetical protein C4J81_18750 (plasmid) [Deltaproteobacteria bacterium Smac51]|nr:hypothetical protein C4J81_18750 [Deltaproteobacteria bacterium Smac51]
MRREDGGKPVLHVVAHLGGGVGRVLLNYLEAVRHGPRRHRLMCLDYANEEARARCAAASIPLADRLSERPEELAGALAEAAAAVVHWWNHPLMFKWLTGGRWPAARVLMWSHVSGRAAPQPITEALAAFPDLFAAASPVSLKLPALAEAAARNRARLLFSTAGVGHLAGAAPKAHHGFRVGYLGTVDYAKMHPDFIDLCLSAGLPEAVFAVAGGPEHEALRRETERRGVARRFEILGPVDDPQTFLSTLDVFGYPLNPDHYGTGEQVLIEAQAAGVPPVVLAGGAEEYVVEHGATGLAAPLAADYGPCLKQLHDEPEMRLKLSRQAAARAGERFGLEAFIEKFEALLAELMAFPKAARRWPGLSAPPRPWEMFLLSQGRAAPFFERTLAEGRPPGPVPPAWLSRSRGTVFHYADFFPEDERLRKCAGLLDGNTIL